MKIITSQFDVVDSKIISLDEYFPIENSIIYLFNSVTNTSKGIYYVNTLNMLINANTGKQFKPNKQTSLKYKYLYNNSNSLSNTFFKERKTGILYDTYGGLISGVDGSKFTNSVIFLSFTINVKKILNHINLITLLEKDIVFSKREILNLIHRAYDEGYDEQLGTSQFEGDRLKFIISLFQEKIQKEKNLQPIFF